MRDTIEASQEAFTISAPARSAFGRHGKGTALPLLSSGQCQAPCQGLISEKEYGENVRKVLEFLKGIIRMKSQASNSKMAQAASEMKYEEAAQYRDLIQSIRQIGERQKITGSDGDDRDVIAIAMDNDESNAVAQVFFPFGTTYRAGAFPSRPGITDDPGMVLEALFPSIMPELLYSEGTYAGTSIFRKRTSRNLAYPKRGSRVQIRIPQKE